MTFQPFNLQFSQFLVRDEDPLLARHHRCKSAVCRREGRGCVADRCAGSAGSASAISEADECGCRTGNGLLPQSDAVCQSGRKVVSVTIVLRPSGEGDGGRGGPYHGADTRFQFLVDAVHAALLGVEFPYSKTPIGLWSAQICFTQADVVNRRPSRIKSGRCREVLKEYQQGPLPTMPHCTLDGAHTHQAGGV